MFYISEIQHTAPSVFKTALQKKVYQTLKQADVTFERVDTDEAITMEDCVDIGHKLKTPIVKTLFLCNRQETNFYLVVTTADKPFKTKDFSSALNISRVSFASPALLQEMLGVTVGAATVFGVMLDTTNKVRVVIDKDVLTEEWYGCSDGTTTGYMKVSRDWVMHDFLPRANHTPEFVQL